MRAQVGERLALAAQVYAPLLAMALSHLQRHMLTGEGFANHHGLAKQTLLGPAAAAAGHENLRPGCLPACRQRLLTHAGSYEVRVACVQALAKVAVRSPEPFRIQAYATLRTAAGSPAPTGSADPLGLAPVALPVLEILDHMYAGQSVVAAHCNLHGSEAKCWPGAALASLRRRHEWLVAAIAQRIGGVPKEGFYPLGRRSRALLNPGEGLRVSPPCGPSSFARVRRSGPWEALKP